MSDKGYQLYCCGSRGSRPVEGRRFNEFGGFTSCYVLKKDDYALIIDCGTGLYEANAIVLDCSRIDVVLTHMHYDHMLGMLDWAAIPNKAKVTFYSSFDEWFGEKTFEEFFKKPFWPVQPNFFLRNTPKDNTSLTLREDLKIDFYKAAHPDQTQLMIISAEIKNKTRKIVIMFDCEKSDSINSNLISDCDYLLYDGMYTDAEYQKRKDFGHSTWQEGCRLATRVNCKRLIITHHDPNRTDEELRRFEQLARDIYPDTDFARSGQRWDFPNKTFNSSKKAKSEPAKSFESTRNLFARFSDIITDNELRKKYMSIGCYAILSLISLFMTVVNIVTDKRLLMYSTLIFSIFCFLCIILDAALKVNYLVVQTIFQIGFMILCTFFIVSGTPEGFSAIWLLLLPLAGMFLFGKIRTTILCAILFAIIIFFFYVPVGQHLLQYRYTDSFMMRFPMAFAAFYAVGLFLEIVREKTLEVLEKVKNNQAITIANQTSELREQNFNMLRTNSKLQLRNQMLSKYVGQNLSDDMIQEILNSEEEIIDPLNG